MCLLLHYRLLITGYRRALQEDDLWLLDERSQSHHIVPRVHKEWDQELRKSCRYMYVDSWANNEGLHCEVLSGDGL